MKNKFVSSKYRGASNRLGPILENFWVRAFLNLELNIGTLYCNSVLGAVYNRLIIRCNGVVSKTLHF